MIRRIAEQPATAEPKKCPKGGWVFDLGQNIVGRIRLRVDVPAGTKAYAFQTITRPLSSAPSPPVATISLEEWNLSEDDCCRLMEKIGTRNDG